MNSIDLVDFAEHSQKLPGKFLTPPQKEEMSTWKLLLAHSFDIGMVFTMTAFIGAFYNAAFRSLMMTRSLRRAFSDNTLFEASTNFLPLMIFSYFFLSYFMNHGQSLGMLMVKARVDMASKSFKESFTLAAHSLFLCLSCGLSLLFMKDLRNKFKSHDYLYENLIAFKEVSPIHLLNEIDNFAEEKPEEEIEWIKAA